MTVVMTMSMMLGSARGQLGESGVRFKGLRPAQITQVPIGGGGAVTYLAQHPQEPDIKYLVADVAGLHRWNPPSQSWTPLHDAFGPDNVRGMHGELVAIHPTNPQLLVYSAGTRWATGPYALYRSTDGGQTWSDPITLAGTDGKPTYITNGGTGHRLVFDPHHGQTI
ncbi:MAG TPA: sialidase family protein, partial [Tepidisphaeraceae bacterium]|nr:sialidase family protein [Tepidisphaeraceae bacterium]